MCTVTSTENQETELKNLQESLQRFERLENESEERINVLEAEHNAERDTASKRYERWEAEREAFNERLDQVSAATAQIVQELAAERRRIEVAERQRTEESTQLFL